MKPFKEKIYNKLYSMASILLDNIVIPGEAKQEGSDSIIASYYDEEGNKYTFTLSLNVTPETEDEIIEPEPITLAEQIAAILEKVTALETEVALLKGYHVSNEIQTDSPTEEQNG